MKHSLVIQGARFGDLIQSKRLILSLARTHKVHLLLDRALLDLAQLLYPHAMPHGFVFHQNLDGEGLNYNRATLQALSQQPFEQVINCNFSRLTDAVCRLFAPQKIIGYRPAQDSDGGFLRSAWARLAFRLAAMRPSTPLNLVDFWANFISRPVPPGEVNPVARGGGQGLGIAVAGREERRSIPLPALAQMAQTMFQLLKAPQIRLFGTSAELPRAKKLLRLFTAPMLERCQNLCGATGWPELMAQMQGLDCLITPDTGLMHLAVHLGVPVLACFLSSAWAQETGPYGLGHIIVQAASPCAPCLECAPCPHNLLCHAPWNNPQLARFIAQAWTGQQASPPAGLQLWASDLDALGAAPRLLAGEDRDSLRRQILRNIVANKLGLAPMEEAHMAERQHLLRELEPAAEFMLPPERYC